MKRLTPRQRDALELVAGGRIVPVLRLEEDGWHARWRAFGAADNPWVDMYVRAAASTPLAADAENQRHETLHDAWIMALRSDTGLVRWDGSECAEFAASLDAWASSAEASGEANDALEFRFSAGKSGDGPFAVSCARPRGRRALLALGQSVHVCGALRDMRSAPGGSLSVTLSRAEAENFLSSGARDLVRAGYRVSGCDLSASVSAAVDLDSLPESSSSGAGKIEARLSVKVAGETVDAEEIRFLLEQKSTLVFFRDRWIEVDRNILKEALRALEKNSRRELTVNAALGFACGVGAVGRLRLDEARAHGWLRGLVNELRRSSPSLVDFDSPVPGLSGTLRPYQRRGVAWAAFLASRGFGALLADDMGLGKTVQTIAWILSLREEAAGAPFLVVAPLTLLANWRHEFARFAPSLRICTHQGDSRSLEMGFSRDAAASDVVLTSYTLLVKDHSAIRRVAWGGLVLDEAQAIKNPDTLAARAARSLGVPRRLALTGTPVENSAADIWSLEEFLNPGFLGDRKSFAERFVKPISGDGRSAAAKRLKWALEPFVLRRLKTDREIAAELGEKRSVKEYCLLSPAQRRDYEAALADFSAGGRSRGDVFALITELKLICDGDGKMERLAELLEAVFASDESALVFTQYAKVGARLKGFLEARFRRRVPFLHGGLSAKAREGEIARFNADGATAFILSLKAGGFGLNLVKATHVIHFDRWWNPAVEAQATDRAHRIGQTRPVLVHAFITEGTLEEHVDEILERKSLLAGSLVGEGENFLKLLAPGELDEALKLS
ncbi:MAG: DEAD/DEAH box helicase [Kiritimatiellae bacterium]|nr:DEAD/DEAH box helicase [Kiritimatiellia bacterium]